MEPSTPSPWFTGYRAGLCNAFIRELEKKVRRNEGKRHEDGKNRAQRRAEKYGHNAGAA